jgi:hypothetical protein
MALIAKIDNLLRRDRKIADKSYAGMAALQSGWALSATSLLIEHNAEEGFCPNLTYRIKYSNKELFRFFVFVPRYGDTFKSEVVVHTHNFYDHPDENQPSDSFVFTFGDPDIPEKCIALLHKRANAFLARFHDAYIMLRKIKNSDLAELLREPSDDDIPF